MSLPRIPFIFVCAAIAALHTASQISWQYDLNWPLVESFPISWLSIGLSYLAVFFHEIGHVIFGWLFGYPSLPSFDLNHGGGMAYLFDRSYILVFAMYAGIGAFIWRFRSDSFFLKLAGVTWACHAFLNFTTWHLSLIDFMGHGFELMIASFCIWRAWHDKAVNELERWLNGVVGLGMIFSNMALFVELIVSESQKMQYLKQKGQHGFGDFSKIRRAFGFETLDPVAIFAIACAAVALIVPFVLFKPCSRAGDGGASTDY